MTKTFKYARMACGLSQSEAAAYLGVSLSSVQSFDTGRRPVPDGVWSMLADLFERIQDAADFAADHMAEAGIDARAFQNVDADDGNDPLPESSAKLAGAMALLMAVRDSGG